MRNIIPFLAICPLLSLGAEGKKANGIDLSLAGNTFILEVWENGKITEARYKVHLSIFDYCGKPYADWNCIFVSPNHNLKQMLMNPFHFSTHDETIKQLIVHEDNFSFNLQLTSGRVIQIVGTRNKELKYSWRVEGVGIFYSDILKENLKMEWKPTTEKIKLLYTEMD